MVRFVGPGRHQAVGRMSDRNTGSSVQHALLANVSWLSAIFTLAGCLLAWCVSWGRGGTRRWAECPTETQAALCNMRCWPM